MVQEKNSLRPFLAFFAVLILFAIGIFYGTRLLLDTSVDSRDYGEKRQYSQVEIRVLKKDNDLITSGHDHYASRCGKCHGFFGEGSYKAPSLVDDDWIYGSGFNEILDVIKYGGKLKGKHSWSYKLHERELLAMALYVQALIHKATEDAKKSEMSTD